MEMIEQDVDILKIRDQLEELYSWDFDLYVEHEAQIIQYGLDAKLFDKLEWLAEFYFENDRGNEFINSKFYQSYGELEHFQRIIRNYE